MIDRSEAADIRLATLANEPMENADSSDPTLPIESTDPIEPMDRIEPCEPIDKIESFELIDHSEREPAGMAPSCVTRRTLPCGLHSKGHIGSETTPL